MYRHARRKKVLYIKVETVPETLAHTQDLATEKSPSAVSITNKESTPSSNNETVKEVSPPSSSQETKQEKKKKKEKKSKTNREGQRDESYSIGTFPSSTFIEWAHSTKISTSPILPNSYKISERIIQIGVKAFERHHLESLRHLLLWLELFEKSILEYEDRKHKSKIEFNEKMKSLNIDREDTSIFIYAGSEVSTSCYKTVCTFAPTFPQNKYEERESYLGKDKVLTFVEAPGTGKTHFGYHLTTTNRLVIPLLPKHIDHLYTKIIELHDYGEGKEKRNRLNKFTQNFTEFYQRVANLLHEYAIVFMTDSNIEISSSKIKQYVLRKVGGVVLTTTLFTSVAGHIDQVISKETGKDVLEKFSFDFNLLPTLNSQQVIQFLQYFIKIEQKESFLWSNVSFLLQGTIRNVESFLQHLFQTTDSIKERLIYSSLLCVCNEKTNNAINRIDEKLTNSLPMYKYIFYKLAVSGEISLSDLNLNSALPKVKQFLICDGISFTIQHERNSFKLLSCLEKGRMLRYIFDKFGGNDWVKKVYNILIHQSVSKKKDISLLSEVFVIDILINKFDLLIVPLFKKSTFSRYSLEAKYYFEDSDTSEIASNDTKLSSIMLQYIAQNLSNRNNPITMFLSRPGKYARADVLGVLTLRNGISELPNSIPLSVAITRKSFKSDGPHYKMVKDFASTDLNTMYNNHIISTNSLNENRFVQDEKSKISSALEVLKKTPKVRLLFHPNQKYSQTLKERIEKGLYNIGTTNIKVVTELTDYSVILDDNSCLIEISSGIEEMSPKWQPVFKSWKKMFGKTKKKKLGKGDTSNK